jgi:hypothetical protein
MAVRQAGKRGKKDLVRIPLEPEVEARKTVTTVFPPVPNQILPPPSINWGMYGNDQWGDCVIAGTVHAIMLSNWFALNWDKTIAVTDVVPTNTQAVNQYKALTGAVTPGCNNDTGLSVAPYLHQWKTQKMFGDNELVMWAPVNYADIEMVYQTINIYGFCALGVQLPQSAETQFNNNQPWTYVGDPSIGGHFIIVVGYNKTAQTLTCVTWGALQEMTVEWFNNQADESYALVMQAFKQSGKGPETSLAQMEADIVGLNPNDHGNWWYI